MRLPCYIVGFGYFACRYLRVTTFVEAHGDFGRTHFGTKLVFIIISISFSCMRAFSCINYDVSLVSISHNKVIIFFNKRLAIGVKITK